MSSLIELKNFDCPYCIEKGFAKSKLEKIESENKNILIYVCKSCASSFDFFSNKFGNFQYYYIKRKNPEFFNKLNSDDFMDNIGIYEDLENEGIIKEYDKTYFLKKEDISRVKV